MKKNHMSETLEISIFRPQGPLKGSIAVVHGMAEHRRRYDGLAESLKDAGYGVITYDLPGHGEACLEADLGWFGPDHGWDRLVNSAVQISEQARKEFPDVPLVLFGHSMGTMIARCMLQDHDSMLDGVILSGAPTYQSATGAGIAIAKTLEVFKGKRGHSKLMDQMATGNFNKTIKNPRTTCDWLSFNTDNVDKYLADPRCGFGFTLQGYVDELTGMKRMHETERYHCTKPDLPIWIFAGGEDPTTGGTAGLADSMKTLTSAGYRNVTCSEIPGMRHETLHEKDAASVRAMILDWLREHCEKPQ